MVLGGGPNRIGQGIEFDWCCCHAAFALRARGYEVVMVNSNPETVSTDYDTSDKLYFEPLTFEDVMEIYDREKCDGVIVQYGGQTPLNLAERLEAAGARIVGVNCRNLRNFSTDVSLLESLVGRIPRSCLRVAESGMHTAEAIRRAKSAGADGFLVGTALMRAERPGEKLKELLTT
jgi:carbamoyl-phosphate synthase large subunit